MSQADLEHSRMMEKEGIPLMACQVRQAARLMARAFYDDPFFTFVLPEGERRRSILPWMFEKISGTGSATVRSIPLQAWRASPCGLARKSPPLSGRGPC